jgi:hypothetical protein
MGGLTYGNVKHRTLECLCKKCQEDNRYFANALRNWLGLPPLYHDNLPTSRVHYHRRHTSQSV